MQEAAYEEVINGFLFREMVSVKKLRYLVLGLPDVGLVGAITAMHLVKTMGMDESVYIDSYTMLPPVAVIRKGSPLSPIRIYVKGELGVMVTDVPIAPPAVAPLATALVEYARSRGVELLISVTGLGNPSRIDMEKPGTYWIASTRDATLEAGRLPHAKPADGGILVGPYAIIVKESARKRVNNLVILVDSFIDLPDPEAASEAVKAISRLTGIDVPVDDLLKQAEDIKLRMREFMRETKNVLSSMGKSMEYRTPLLYT